MKRVAIVGVVALAVSGCSSDSVPTPTRPETVTLPLQSASASTLGTLRHAGTAHNHAVHLSGDEEPLPLPPAPTPSDSNGQGQAIIQIADDNLSFDYKLIASNIDNAFMAHIHCGPRGANGPIVVWLYPSPTGSAVPLDQAAGRYTGVLAEGTVVSGMAGHVRSFTDNAANRTACPGVTPSAPTFADVLAQIRSGNAYVNVHTNDGIAPTNTGPGDFPGGEIRGQF